MSLSKPVNKLLIAYLQELFSNPIRTKSISCCVIATCGNLVSQLIAGNKVIDKDSLFVYGLYGLLFGGTIPHYFFLTLDRVVPGESKLSIVLKLVIERLMYAPLYQAFTLYVMARLEGKKHREAMKQLVQLHWPVVLASWKYLTVFQAINLAFVPPMLRVLVFNLVGFFWTVYLATVRRRAAAAAKK